MLYIDTSVLVAFYCPERISEQVEDILINTEEPAVSQLTEIELVSAVSRKIRDKRLSKEDGNKILSIFQTHLEQKSFIYLPIQSKCYTNAKKWIVQFDTPLKTLDALHLAIAKRNNISMLTADVKFAKSAKKIGIEVTLIS